MVECKCDKRQVNDKWSEAALKAKREYQATWRRQNQGKLKEYARRYWERQASKSS